MILDIKIVDDEFSDEFEDDEDFAAGLQDRATKEANVNVEKKAGLEDVDEEEDEAIRPSNLFQVRIQHRQTNQL